MRHLKSISEGLGHAEVRRWMKHIKDYAAPFAVIAIENKKVIDQEISIQNYELLPAVLRLMAKKHPNATIFIEDGTGQRVG